MPVHLYGRTADLKPLLSLAREKNLQIIEDACQATVPCSTHRCKAGPPVASRRSPSIAAEPWRVRGRQHHHQRRRARTTARSREMGKHAITTRSSATTRGSDEMRGGRLRNQLRKLRWPPRMRSRRHSNDRLPKQRVIHPDRRAAATCSTATSSACPVGSGMTCGHTSPSAASVPATRCRSIRAPHFLGYRRNFR
jgi:hypothetical protein